MNKRIRNSKVAYVGQCSSCGGICSINAEMCADCRFEDNAKNLAVPTPQQIEEECRKIREGWSEEEYYKRAGMIVERYRLPLIFLPDTPKPLQDPSDTRDDT